MQPTEPAVVEAAPAVARADAMRCFGYTLSTLLLGGMTLLPLLTVGARLAGIDSLSSPITWTQALNFALTFLGAWLGAHYGRHITIAMLDVLGSGQRTRRIATFVVGLTATAVSCALIAAAISLVLSEMDAGTVLPGGVHEWMVQLAMPIGLMATLPAWLRASGDSWRARIEVVVGALLILGLVYATHGQASTLASVTMVAALLLAMCVGTPLYLVLGGIALVLMYGADVPLAAIPAETYTLISSPTLPALPLFTLTGYLLAEGGASRRIVALFDACFAWMPGGVAVAAVLVCAFFTTFTGASGVTILALGGLLLPALMAAGYSRSFAIGLLTASGSIGLLFPPSLPVILYGVVAQVPVDRLFLAAWKPGVMLVALLAGFALWRGLRDGIQRKPFDARRCLRAVRDARYELLIPVIVLWGIFGGVLTVLEAAALATAAAFISEVWLHRDLSLRHDIPRIAQEAAILIGGVLIILGMAMGLTNYLVDAQAPDHIADWVRGAVDSRWVFLALLNLLLLVVGCLMDIYSAIMVVVPLIIPISRAFGIDPMHLGVIFLANLELGFLTPPVGMNLFMASTRFNEPLVRIYRIAVPFLLIMMLGVLLITYLPWLSVGERKALPVINLPMEMLELE